MYPLWKPTWFNLNCLIFHFFLPVILCLWVQYTHLIVICIQSCPKRNLLGTLQSAINDNSSKIVANDLFYSVQEYFVDNAIISLSYVFKHLWKYLQKAKEKLFTHISYLSLDFCKLVIKINFVTKQQWFINY